MFNLLFRRKKSLKETSEEDGSQLPTEMSPLPVNSPLPIKTSISIGGQHPSLSKPQNIKEISSSYRNQLIVDLIGEEKIQQKLTELSDNESMLTSFSNFITKSSRFSETSEIRVLNNLLHFYFSSDAEVAELVYHASKKYSGHFVDRHFLFSQIIKVFEAHKSKNFFLHFVGEYSFDKNKLSNDRLTLHFKKRRAPGIGHYLLFKDDSDYGMVWNLTKTEGDGDVWGFESNFGKFILQFLGNRAFIENIDKSTDRPELPLQDYSYIVDEMTKFYIENFTEFSNAMKKDMDGTKIANAFVWDVYFYYPKNESKWRALVTKNNRYHSVWTSIDE